MSGSVLFREQSSIEWYNVLGLSPPSLGKSYSNNEIRRAYRKRALELHPDKRKNDPEAPVLFNRLQQALEVLSDETKRQQYDETFFEIERRKAKLQSMDAEKRKLAQELKKREAQAAKERASTHDIRKDFPNKSFRKRQLSKSSEEDSFARKQILKKQAELNAKFIAETAGRLNTDNISSNHSIKESISETHYFVLQLRWHATERISESSLRTLLAPYRPFSVKRFDANHGSSQIVFFAQARAMEAAMATSFVTDEPEKLSAVGLPRDLIMNSRVIKKARNVVARGATPKSIGSSDDEEEMQAMLAERAARLRAKASQSVNVSGPTLSHLTVDITDGDDDVSVSIFASSDIPPPSGPSVIVEASSSSEE